MKKGNAVRIAFFDSGIGGLSVLEEALSRRPEVEFLYYADTDHVPYGQKSRAALIDYAGSAVSFLLAAGADAVVVACNTATAAAIDFLREQFAAPIFGMEPAVKPALAETAGRRVLVLATPLTLREQKLHHLLDAVDPAHCADLLPLPGLVAFAERREFDGPAVQDYLQQALAPFTLANYGAVVLGCTHFNYFKDSLAALLPAGIQFVDGCRGTVNHVFHTLGLSAGDAGVGTVHYFQSGRAVTDPVQLDDYHILLARLSWLRHL